MGIVTLNERTPSAPCRSASHAPSRAASHRRISTRVVGAGGWHGEGWPRSLRPGRKGLCIEIRLREPRQLWRLRGCDGVMADGRALGVQNPFDAWMGQARKGRGRRAQEPNERHGLRFAFYGRTSTVEHQDRFSSCHWQREVAESVINGRGVIVEEFFDVGCSRRLPWASRPAASALLDAVAAGSRPFDAVVVGEYERAFYGDQFAGITALFQRVGVQIWLPEAGGPVHPGTPCITR